MKANRRVRSDGDDDDGGIVNIGRRPIKNIPIHPQVKAQVSG